MPVLNIKQHDTRTAIKASLKSPKGLPVNLTGCTVEFTMKWDNKSSENPLIDRETDVLDEENGVVVFVFNPDEITALGLMKAEFRVTYPDGSQEPFPNSGYIKINIIESLGR